MLPRRASLGSGSPSGPLLALCACLWGCPQLLSDDFSMLEGVPDEIGQGTGGSAAGNAGQAGTGGSGSSAGSGGSAGSAGTSSGSGGTGVTPASQPGPPSVVSVSPDGGASGVAANADIVVTFSEPMDPGSVADAYDSLDLPASAVSFNWSAGNTVLTLTPLQPLALASGADPDTTTARSYSFVIGSAALDLDGEALPRFSTHFTTLRQITQTLAAVNDRTLTGNWRSDDIRGNNSCEELDANYTTCIGDSSNDNSIYRGFVTFDLPAQIQQVSAAELGMFIHTIRGTPFAALGNLLAERVNFDSINLVAFNATALGSPIMASSSMTAGTQLNIDVLAAVQDDLATRARSQFRFRFSDLTDSNLEGDLIETNLDTETLELTYLIP